jgi:diguanylate cyclase (GGDEF)-like protein
MSQENHNFGPHTVRPQFIPTEYVPLVKERNRAERQRDEGLGRVAILEETIERTQIDTLTGLPNGEVFWNDINAVSKRLTGENPDNRSVVLIMGDVDGLKRTNTALGRSGGDKLLISSTETLKSKKRTEDKWYRLGGGADEIVGLLRGVRPDKNGDYNKTIDKITQQKSDEVDENLRADGLPVDELRLGMQFVGAVLEPGKDPKELFEELDKILTIKKKEARSQLPEELQADDRYL